MRATQTDPKHKTAANSMNAPQLAPVVPQPMPHAPQQRGRRSQHDGGRRVAESVVLLLQAHGRLAAQRHHVGLGAQQQPQQQRRARVGEAPPAGWARGQVSTWRGVTAVRCAEMEMVVSWQQRHNRRV